MPEHTPENHELDAMARDFTSVVPRSKSEVRRRIHEYWKDGYQAGRQSLLVEIEGMRRHYYYKTGVCDTDSSYNRALDDILKIISKE